MIVCMQIYDILKEAFELFFAHDPLMVLWSFLNYFFVQFSKLFYFQYVIKQKVPLRVAFCRQKYYEDFLPLNIEPSF